MHCRVSRKDGDNTTMMTYVPLCPCSHAHAATTTLSPYLPTWCNKDENTMTPMPPLPLVPPNENEDTRTVTTLPPPWWCQWPSTVDDTSATTITMCMKWPNLLKSWRLARARERPLSVALNGRLKSKRVRPCVARVKMGNLQVNKTGGNQLSALGLSILSRGLHLCTLDLQISCATVHEENMRSIA